MNDVNFSHQNSTPLPSSSTRVSSSKLRKPIKTMQSEAFQPSWPLNFDQVGFYGLNHMDAQFDAFEYFSPSFTTNISEDTSDDSSNPYFFTNYPMEFTNSPPCPYESQITSPVEDFWENLERFDPNNYDEVMNFINGNVSLNDREGNVLSSQDLSVSCPDQVEGMRSPTPSIRTSEGSVDNLQPIQLSSLILPGDDMDTENGQGGLFHLLKAYGEAIEGHQRELADVIMRCVNEKVGPLGNSLERLAFYLSQGGEKSEDKNYIRLESCKNLEAAFRTFYQVFPYGKFAHFAANSAILEGIPVEAEVIHIVDFDLGEGVQWPPVIEALANQHREVKLTALKWENDQEDCDKEFSSMCSFEVIKRRLTEHGSLCGLKLKVEEMGIEGLVSDIKKGRKRGGRREYLAFNCMVALPHMGRVRSRKLVEEFLRVAKESLSYTANFNSSNRGLIILGDGDALDSSKISSGFGSFFERNLAHHQALLDSIEFSFPSHLSEARMAMETLFVAPFMSFPGWVKKWEEIREGCSLQMGSGLEGWRLGRLGLEEAREMVRDKQSSFAVKTGGCQDNEMILEWKGISLLKVSAWRC